MKKELTKKDLIHLVRGTSPSYDVMRNPIVAKCGSYTGGFHDKWDWNYKFDDDITEEQLWELYILCCKPAK